MTRPRHAERRNVDALRADRGRHASCLGTHLMNTDEYVRAKQDQLKEWERTLEARGAKLTEVLREKRDTAMKKLDALKTDSAERLDVLRMGVESAWDELKVAFETATSK